MRLKRPLYGPQHERGPSRGRDVRDFVKRTLHRMPAQTGLGENFFPKPPGGFDDVYNAKTVEAVRVVQLFNGITPTTGNMGQATLDALWQYADAYSKWVYRLWSAPPVTKVPALGPAVAGGKSVLEHDLTHATAGVPGYPAFDDGWFIGMACLAPEDMVISGQSGAQGGDACYARGTACDWWFGHIHKAPATGLRFRKGERFALISADHKKPHLHVGINTDRLLGHELEHHTNYTHGAPTVGAQMRKELGG